MKFEFATAGRILFGQGVASELPALARDFGRKAIVLTHDVGDVAGELLGDPQQAGFSYEQVKVTGEPSVALARRGAALARTFGAEFIVAIGGGSVMDAGKAIGALAANIGDPLDYLEVIGLGRPLQAPSLPVIAVPTTAGTGAEVTRNAVLASEEHAVKVSLRSPHMLPRIALVDPLLTVSVPPAVTASTGLDALTQLIEPFTSIRANPVVDGFCREGIRRAARALQPAVRDGSDLQAREEMTMASLLGGLSLANAGLGVVHGFAAPIGGAFRAPHGAICAALLPHAMKVNVAALRRRLPHSHALGRYDEIGRIVTGLPDAGAEYGMAWVAALVAELKIPRLGAYGIGPDAVPGLVARAQAASSTRGNPIPLSEAELTEILVRSL
jgi:alcohol dehydrogenase class IV